MKSMAKNEKRHDGDEMIARENQKSRLGQTKRNIGGRGSWFKGRGIEGCYYYYLGLQDYLEM